MQYNLLDADTDTTSIVQQITNNLRFALSAPRTFRAKAVLDLVNQHNFVIQF